MRQYETDRIGEYLRVPTAGRFLHAEVSLWRLQARAFLVRHAFIVSLMLSLLSYISLLSLLSLNTLSGRLATVFENSRKILHSTFGKPSWWWWWQWWPWCLWWWWRQWWSWTLRKRIPSPHEALQGLHWSTMKLWRGKVSEGEGSRLFWGQSKRCERT